MCIRDSGVTDFAAARFFYGDNVSVYTAQNYKPGTKIGTGITLATDTFGGLLGITYGLRAGSGGTGVDNFHYSQLQNNYNVISSCYPATPQRPDWWNDDVDGLWDPLLDGLVVSVGGLPTKCQQQRVDYAAYSKLRAPTDAETNRGYY